MDRHTKLNLMKDILDHLRNCYEQWALADDRSEHYLAETMRRDLDECRRLCDSLGGVRQMARAA